MPPADRPGDFVEGRVLFLAGLFGAMAKVEVVPVMFARAGTLGSLGLDRADRAEPAQKRGEAEDYE
jgi:hypothetical protein